MDKQEIFNKVYEALLEQGKSSTKNGICKYRGQGGSKCAIGHLIPDELYNPNIEGLMFNSLPEYILENILENNEDCKSLLLRLQRAHDQQLNFYGIKEWKERMKEIADEFNLVFPSI